MIPVGLIVSEMATGAGFLAASIAVFGFLLQVPSALAGKRDQDVRVATVAGGLFGFVVAAGAMLIGDW